MPPAQSVEIYPLEGPIDATLALPGSKSFTNRALVLAALCKGTSKLRSPLFSDDSYWCVDALAKLGIGVQSDRENGLITITGSGKLKMQNEKDLPYIGSAGTIARFLPGVIAARGEGTVTLTSSAQLAKRPVLEMIEALRRLGADIRMEENSSFPMTIKGGSLIGGETSISGKVSSQFISGLLIAAPLAKEPVTIRISDYIVQADYVRITLALMKDFGVKVEHDAELKEFHIEPQDYIAQDIELEADASTATYFFALAAATRSRVTITNLNPATLQPDFLFVNHLKTLGCTVRQDGTHVTVSGPEKLTGDKLFNFNDCSDSTPALIALAPFAQGSVDVEGVAHIRKHECDRLSVMRETLDHAGVPVVEREDGLLVKPAAGFPKHVIVDPHDDHRMAMAFSIMGAAGQGATIMDPTCVSKTCPDFFELLQRIGVKCVVNS